MKNIKTPTFQRIVDYNHVEQIYNNFKKEYIDNNTIFTNIFHIATVSEQSNICLVNRTLQNTPQNTPQNTIAKQPNYYLLDGQHRFIALEKLLSVDKVDYEIDTFFHIVKNEDSLYTLFTKINSSKPVNFLTEINAQKESIVVSKYLTSTYPSFIKTTDKPMGFNFNLEKLQIEFRKQAIYEFNSSSIIEVIKLIADKFNSMKDDLILTQYCKRLLEKTDIQIPLFTHIGLLRFSQLVKCILKREEIHWDIWLKPVKHCKKIRELLWTKYNGNNMIGKCYCCSDVINYNNFHISHVRAKVLGGDDSLSNLRPCCATCNLDMGIQNLEEYKKMINL